MNFPAVARGPVAPIPIRDPGVTTEPVRSPADLTAFLELPYRVYRGDPNWAPPLLMERKDFLDPRKNPFFKHAPRELFLARRGGEVVGRIAAVEDKNFNAFHATSTGFFGLYEAVDDAAVAWSLFEAARGWVRARGLKEILGPMNLSTNQECGLLVEGFERPAVVMMTYNPRYYVAHFEEVLGLAKAKDLFAWWLDSSIEPPEKVVRIAEKVRAKEGVTVRHVDLKRFDAEVARVKEIYNAAWEKNWGFVPFTDEEFDFLANDLKRVVVPELLLLAEVRGEPAAFSMALPDVNQALIHVGGRLTTFGLPIGLARLLYWSRKIDQVRLVTLGIKQAYRKRGLDAILYLDTVKAARKLGFKGGEISWTLEDNVLINRAIEMMGGKRYKLYRLYSVEA